VSGPTAPDWPQLAGRLVDGGHVLPIRIYDEDTDFSGVVYHANYLRFMERGRSDFLRLLGVEQGALFAEAQAEAPGFAFVVRSMRIDFLRPARVDDVIEVHTRPKEIAGASVTLHQRVLRGDTLLVEAEVRVAFVAGERAQRIPAALRRIIRAGSGG
jgi:acyl-CoA thioester hydrolase